MTTAATEDQAPGSAETPKGHPVGLYFLFATEMWERFSYYGMRALLVLYFVSYHAWQPRDSSQVYKWYTSLVYLTPLLGGYLADRYLGLRASIIIGGALMAIGHFLMAFPPLPAMFAALAFLILGNGFFKPNISTLVGRMYGPNDQRRDGAFTIFYMGINVGAFFSPLVCGWLQDRFGFHYGFGAAGVGMVIGLVIFLVGQGKISEAVRAAGNEMGRPKSKKESVADKDNRDERDAAILGAGGFANIISQGLPLLMLVLAVLWPAKYIYEVAFNNAHWTEIIMPIAFAGIAAWMAMTLRTIKGASRDKSTVIFALFFFSVLFWMAFEQAGNALNLWAEFHTERILLFVRFPAPSYQAINPALIVLLGPVFAALWIGMARRSIGLSIPAKMAIAMVFMTLSFGAMVGAAVSERGTVTNVSLNALPPGVDLSKINAGRTSYDSQKHELSTKGTLPSYAITAAFEPTVDPKYLESVKKLEAESKNASEKNPVAIKLEALPAGFELPLDDKQKEKIVTKWDSETSTVTIKSAIDVDVKNAMLAAAAPEDYRNALKELEDKSNAARVTGLWLLLSYLLATLGELCLSPVGLSMVTKLAPARFASLFMGVWLLASSVAQYVGGSLGESWGIITPTSYFTIFVWTSAVGAVVLFLLVKPLKKLTHGVT